MAFLAVTSVTVVVLVLVWSSWSAALASDSPSWGCGAPPAPNPAQSWAGLGRSLATQAEVPPGSWAPPAPTPALWRALAAQAEGPPGSWRPGSPLGAVGSSQPSPQPWSQEPAGPGGGLRLAALQRLAASALCSAASAPGQRAHGRAPAILRSAARSTWSVGRG